MGDMVQTQWLSTSSIPPPPRQTPTFRTYCSPHHALRRCRGSAPPHPGEIGGAGARLSFREAKRKYSAASPRCRPEPPAAAQGTRARALPHFADPRQRNFSYRVSSPPLCTALQKQSADRRSSPRTIMLNYSLPSSLRSGSSLSPLNTNAVQNPCCSSCANCLPSFFFAGRTVTSNSPWRVFA